jgi:hypothetical protein
MVSGGASRLLPVCEDAGQLVPGQAMVGQFRQSACLLMTKPDSCINDCLIICFTT